MRFKAIRMGFMGHRIRPGQIFEAADDFKCKWAEPCVTEEVEQPKEPEAETKADPPTGETKPAEPDPPKEPEVEKPKSKAKKD